MDVKIKWSDISWPYRLALFAAVFAIFALVTGGIRIYRYPELEQARIDIKTFNQIQSDIKTQRAELAKIKVQLDQIEKELKK